MILIVTLNPLLEFRFYPQRLTPGSIHRSTPVAMQAGGKGINVSRQLLRIGLHSFNLTFLGPFYGKKYREVTEAEGLQVSAVRTKCDTRIASIAVDPEKREVTTFFSEDAVITAQEADELKAKLDKTIPNCEIVIFSGSSPSAAADSVFPYGIGLANRHDKLSIVDTYGAHFAACIQAGPTAVHTNVRETETSLGISLQTDDEKAAYFAKLYSLGVKQAFLTDGANEFFAANHDFLYKVRPPAVDAYDETGSGDAFTAAVTAGLFNDDVFDAYLKRAAAFGALNAADENVCRVDAGEAERLAASTVAVPFGKKMKLVDVTPTI